MDVRPPLLKAHLPVIVPKIGNDHLVLSEAAAVDTSVVPDLVVDNNDSTNLENSRNVEDNNGGGGSLIGDNNEVIGDSNEVIGDSNGGCGDKPNMSFQKQHQRTAACQLLEYTDSEGDQKQPPCSSDSQIHTKEDPALQLAPTLNQSPSDDHQGSSSPTTVDIVLNQLHAANNELSQGSLLYTDKDMQAIGSRLLSQLKTFASTVGGILLPEQKQSITRFVVHTSTHTSAHTHNIHVHAHMVHTHIRGAHITHTHIFLSY